MMITTDRGVESALRLTRVRRRAVASLGALVLGAGALAATGALAVPAAAAGSSPIPHANSAWIYDGAAGTGVWAQSILGYNHAAGANNKITQVYTYGTDIEGFDGSRTIDDGTYYDGGNRDNGIWDTAAYWSALDQGPQLANGGATSAAPAVQISPIIDGTPDSGNLNSLSSAAASLFADEIADEVCADDNVSGIQFDWEPFNAESPAQQAFYGEINVDFSSSTYGCVDTAHPTGRYFSVFAFGSALAADGPEIAKLLKGDGYFISSLYDLGANGAGVQNGTGSGAKDYPALVAAAVNTTAWYADQNGIAYAFGIPAAASDHEFVDCTGTCTFAGAGDRPGSGGMLDYVKAAVSSIDGVVANSDVLFVGTDIWDFGTWTGVGRPNNAFTKASGTSFDVQPASATTPVLSWLASNLPSYQHTGGSGPSNPAGGGSSSPSPTPTPTPTGSGTNVLTAAQNPGFEGSLVPWTCTDGAAESSVDPSSGAGSLALTPSATATAFCQQTIGGLTPNHRYTFSARLAGGSTPITLTLDQGSVDLTGAASTGSGYATASGTVTTDANGAVTLRIQAYKQQNGTGYADDVSLVSQ
jgi:hypothetical protein